MEGKWAGGTLHLPLPFHTIEASEKETTKTKVLKKTCFPSTYTPANVSLAVYHRARGKLHFFSFDRYSRTRPRLIKASFEHILNCNERRQDDPQDHDTSMSVDEAHTLGGVTLDVVGRAVAVGQLPF